MDFVLAHDNISVDPVAGGFSGLVDEKHFPEARKISLGNWRLTLFRGKSDPDWSIYETAQGDLVVVFGTLLFNGGAPPQCLPS